MSVVYDTRPYDQDTAFHTGQLHEPQDHEQHDHLEQHEQPRYPSPPPPLSETPYAPQPQDIMPEPTLQQMVDAKIDEDDAPSPGRSKPIPKPDREVTKNQDGRYYCNWPNCTEEVKDFGRRCEWSKHMDKHDRPYKCQAEGCEKLPGFTYSGGLLRHEREVHNKHGGPRKQLNCPHPNCKRHTGKGFSRQENLNEHLRRVHTDSGAQNGDETEEDGLDGGAGQKRKRGVGVFVRPGDNDEIREEMKRLRSENEELREELRRQRDAQDAQSAEMQRTLHQMQAAMQANMQPRMQAPPAHMI